MQISPPDFDFKFISILRCKTWCVWPEHSHFMSKAIEIPIDKDSVLYASIHFVTYEKRRIRKIYSAKPCSDGRSPLIWRGKLASHYEIGNFIVKAPEDISRVALHHQPAFRGEIDVQIHGGCQLPIDLDTLTEVLSAVSLSVIAFINLDLGDLLAPIAPIQIRTVTDTGTEYKNQIGILCREREDFDGPAIEQALQDYSLIFSTFTRNADEKQIISKLRTALELYSAYYYEKAPRTRFLLLIMVFEVLAVSKPKHKVAVDLLDRWNNELETLKTGFDKSSEEAVELESLQRELLFRREKSIRSQVRQLVYETLSSTNHSEAHDYARQAVKLYDQRSVLVHEGSLSDAEVNIAEMSSKKIVELVLKAILKNDC